MAKNETTKSKAEIYREERKARIAKAAKQNAKSIEKRTAFAAIAKKVVAIVLVAAIVCGLGWALIDNLGVVEKYTTALKVGDTKISTAEFNYYYSMQYQQTAYMADYYKQNMGYDMGFNSSVAPDEQKTKDAEGNEITWAEQFKTSAVEQAQFIIANYNEAVKAGLTLTEDEKNEINETIESYRTSAAENNYSLNAYLRDSFGGGFTEKTFKHQLEMETLAQNFYNDKQTELLNAVTDEEIKAEYDANKKNYDYVDVTYYTFAFSTLTGLEGETEDALKTRQQEANDKVKAEAQAVYDKITDKASFVTAVREYKNKDVDAEKAAKDTADYTTNSKATNYSTLSAAISEGGANWAYDAARVAGDKTIITADKAVYVVMLDKPAYIMNSVDVRHCLIQFDAKDSNNVTDEEKQAAYKTAKALYDEWLAGEKTEETFKKMVTENTQDDGSKETAGLYEGIRISDSYVEAFENWSFDDARKAGDSGIIETDYGYHIMYFVKDNTEDVDWKYSIRSNKGNDAFTAFNDSLIAEDGEYPVVETERWINYTADEFCAKIKKNIAYSSQNA